jgi:hypothetical protein
LELGLAPHRNRFTDKTQEHQRVQRLAQAAERGKNGTNDHGAVHDKPDDKLKLIKYQLSARIKAANK